MTSVPLTLSSVLSRTTGSGGGSTPAAPMTPASPTGATASAAVASPHVASGQLFSTAAAAFFVSSSQPRTPTSQPSALPSAAPSNPQAVTLANFGLAADTPGRFAVQQLYYKLISTAESIIKFVVESSLEVDYNLSKLVQPGANELLDQLILALGRIGKHCSAPIVDIMIDWRSKYTGDVDVEVARSRSAEAPGRTLKEIATIMSERRSLLCDYIFCRMLTALVKNVRPESATQPAFGRLEELVFDCVKTTDPDQLQRHKNKERVHDLYAELLGALSGVRFQQLMDRFSEEIKQLLHDNKHERADMMIKSMRFFMLKIFPRKELDESAEFLGTYGAMFREIHGRKEIKHSFAGLFADLLSPIAEREGIDAELNIPEWVKAIDPIYEKAIRMTKKEYHLAMALPLATTLLCVSKKDFFLDNWHTFMGEHCWRNFRAADKSVRAVALQCVCRLMWVYLFRWREPEARIKEKMDALSGVLFPSSKRFIVPTETKLEGFVALVHFMTIRHLDFGMNKVIWVLLGMTESGGMNATAESLCTDRIIIAVKAFLLVLADLEKSVKIPAFPKPTLKSVVAGTIRSRRRAFSTILPTSKIESAGLAPYLSVFNTALGRILWLIDTNINRADRGTLKPEAMRDRSPLLDVAKTIFRAMPRCIPTGELDEIKLYTIIVNFSVHMEDNLAEEAYHALVRIAEQCPDRRVPLVLALGKFICNQPDRFSVIIGRLMELYLNCLNVVTPADVVSAGSEFGHDHTYPAVATAVLGPLRMIEEAEQIGLLMCCNLNAKIRSLALQVIRSAGELGHKVQLFVAKAPGTEDGQETVSETVQPVLANSDDPAAMRRLQRLKHSSEMIAISQRVIHIIDETGHEAIEKILGPQEALLESPDRSDQHPTTQRFRSIEDVAAIDGNDEQGLWIRVLCEMLKTVNELCPGPVHRCWPMITQRLIEMHPSIEATIAPTTGSIRQTISGMTPFSGKFDMPATDDRIAQWRNYLFFATCCAFKAEPESGSSPSKITSIRSARDLFRLILPLLKSDKDNIVNAVVGSLAVTNWIVYKVLLQELHPLVKSIFADDARKRSTSLSRKAESLRLEISRIYYLTGDFFRHRSFHEDEGLMGIVVEYINQTNLYLSAPTQNLADTSKMRRDFCGFVESVYDNVSRNEAVRDKYFPPKIRASLYFLFEEWSGYSASVPGVPREETRTMLHSPSKDMTKRSIHKDGKESSDYNDAQISSELELAAFKAMAALCKGKLVVRDKRISRVFGAAEAEETRFTLTSIFEWIKSLFRSVNPTYQRIARSALENLLFYNDHEPNLLDTVITECYSGPVDSASARGQFLALVDVFIRRTEYPCTVPNILSLILFKAADQDQHVRKSAVQLLQLILERFFPTSVDFNSISLTSSLPTTYKQSQQILSQSLAQQLQGFTIEMLAELTRRVELVQGARQRDMLTTILPWMSNLKNLSLAVLTNLFFLTVKFGDVYVKEIESLWTKLTEDRRDNVSETVSFLLRTGMSIRNPDFASHAKKVIVYIGRTRMCSFVINRIVEHIVPDHNLAEMVNAAINISSGNSREATTEALISAPGTSSSATGNSGRSVYMASLASVLPSTEAPPLASSNSSSGATPQRAISRTELAFILLVDLTIEVRDEIRPHVPLLLHVAFLNMDHLSDHVYEQSRLLLINLIDSLAVKLPIKPEDQPRATRLISLLNENEGKRMWKHEERSIDKPRLSSEAELTTLISKALDVFLVGTPDLRERWAQEALFWTTSCPFQHLANRSAQIFRALKPTLNQQVLADILTRLSDTLASSRADSRIFAMELLITLAMFIDSLDASKLILFPQLFWAAVAVLNSNYEHEFTRGLKMLSKLLDGLNVTDESVRGVLTTSQPLDWQPPFAGIQPLVLKGLMSGTTEQQTISFLSRLSAIKSDFFVDSSDSRLLFTILASLPYLHINANEASENHASFVYASNIAQLCEFKERSNLAKWFKNFNKKRKMDDEALKQLFLAIKEAYFPTFEVQALQFLLDLVDFGPPDYKRSVLMVLRAAITYVGLSNATNPSVNHEDLVGPVFRLLNTEFFEEALLILDHTVSVASTARISTVTVPPTSESSDLWMGRRPWWNMPEQTQSMSRRKLANVRATCFGARPLKRRSRLLNEEETHGLFSTPDTLSTNFLNIPHSALLTESPKIVRSTSLDHSNDLRVLQAALSTTAEMILPSPTVSSVPGSVVSGPAAPSAWEGAVGNSGISSRQGSNSLLNLADIGGSINSTSPNIPALDSVSSDGQVIVSLNVPDINPSRDVSDAQTADLATSDGQALIKAIESSKRNTLRRSKSAPPAMRAASKLFVDILCQPLSCVIIQVQMRESYRTMIQMRTSQNGHFNDPLIRELSAAVNLPMERLELVSLEAVRLLDVIDNHGRPRPPPSPHSSFDSVATSQMNTRRLAESPVSLAPPQNDPCVATIMILSARSGPSADSLVAAEELALAMNSRSEKENTAMDKLRTNWFDPLMLPAIFVVSSEQVYPYIIGGQTMEPWTSPNNTSQVAELLSPSVVAITAAQTPWITETEGWFRWFECARQGQLDPTAADVPIEFRESRTEILTPEMRERALIRTRIALFPCLFQIVRLLSEDFKMALELRLASLSARAVVVQNTIAHLLKMLRPLMDGMLEPVIVSVESDTMTECATRLITVGQTNPAWADAFAKCQVTTGSVVAQQLRTYIYQRAHTNALVMRDDSDQQNRHVSVALCNQATNFVRLLQYTISFQQLLEDAYGRTDGKLAAQHAGTVRFFVSVANYVSMLLSDAAST